MQISIASGKGGTGKTTVATNLALSIGSDVQLLDCDVEEPHAHLFIHGKLRLGEAMSPPLIKKVRDHEIPGKVTILRISISIQ